MELFVAGFNAWNQLQFEGSREGSQSQRDDFEPDDILTFTLVLTDHSIDQVEPFLSYTKGAKSIFFFFDLSFVPCEETMERKKLLSTGSTVPWRIISLQPHD